MAEKRNGVVGAALLVAITCLCLFEQALRHYSVFSAAFWAFDSFVMPAQTQWILPVWIAIWFVAFVILTFRRNDLLLVGFLVVALISYAVQYPTATKTADAMTLFAGLALGKFARVYSTRAFVRFLIWYCVALLAASAWCHLDASYNFYQGPRWVGLWNDPNLYGMLMAIGFILSICLFLEQSQPVVRSVSCLAAVVTGVGLFFSFSRGSWCGVILASIYLANAKGRKVSGRLLLLFVLSISMIIWLLWGLRTDLWYLKRLDLSSTFIQDRIMAWRGSVYIMRDHVWSGVGWNMAAPVYEAYYSSSGNRGSAIGRNDFLMVGAQLGVPALVCFVGYIISCYKQKTNEWEQIACRAGVLVLLTAFWFDGGLFRLPTAVIFWILLELGFVRSSEMERAGKSPNSFTPNS